MKISYVKISTIVQALNAIDPPQAKSALNLNGSTRAALAESVATLQEKLDRIEAVRLKLIRDHDLKRVPMPDGNVRLEGESFDAYQQAWQEAFASEVDVDLSPISIADLDLGTNQISTMHLAALMGTVVQRNRAQPIE
jgi:hypothetical protein